MVNVIKDDIFNIDFWYCLWCYELRFYLFNEIYMLMKERKWDVFFLKVENE